MFKDFKKYGEFELFSENRLLFVRPRKGERRPRYSPKGANLTPAERKKRLAELATDLDNEKFAGTPYKAPKHPTPTHTEDRHTRTKTAPTPYYKKSAEIASERVKLAGQMNAIETKKMQGIHYALYKQYMNPAFMMHLRMTTLPDKSALADTVFPLLDMVMKQPDQFDYRSKGGNITHIVRREPYTKKAEKDKKNEIDIPKDFLVVMEGKDGAISRVEGSKKKANLMVNGKFPWISNEKFRKDMEIYQARWTNELVANLYDEDTATQKEWEKKFKNSFGKISGPIKDIYETMNIDFPKRFLGMIDSRKMRFELEDPQVMALRTHMLKQGKNYDDITKRGYGPNGKFQVAVLPDKQTGGYTIHTRTFQKNPIHVDKEGYILRPQADGRWKRDTRYEEKVRREYYRDPNHAKAKTDLGKKPAERDRMNKINLKDTPNSPTDLHQKKIQEFIFRREAVDQKVYDKSTTMRELKDAAKEVRDPSKPDEYNARRDLAIEASNDRKKLQKEIKITLDGDLGKLDHTRNDKAAVALNLFIPARP